MTRDELLRRITTQGRQDGLLAPFEEVPLLIFTERNVSAGTDPETGLPTLHIDGHSENGRYLLSREAAVAVGAALLAAADPELVVDLIRARAGRAKEKC